MKRNCAVLFGVGAMVMGCAGDAERPDDDAVAGTTSQGLVNAPGADVRVTAFTQTSQTTVDGYQQFAVTVKNFGTADANPTTLTITLLETQTSPQKYLLGSLQALPTGCAVSGRALTCALGRLRYNGPQGGRTRTVTFGYKIPVTTQALLLSASASAIGEPPANATDNAGSVTASVDYRAVAVTAGIKSPSHCTGTGLTAYFECTKFPSSISSHDAEYHLDGTITFPGAEGAGYSGTWLQADPTRLHFEYHNGSYTEAIFDGRGADANCFEGITRFYSDDDNNSNTPPVLSTYSAPYRVCF